jgi:hypothetical protein
MDARSMRRIFKLWPPFLSGIHVGAIGDDWRREQVELRRAATGEGAKHLHWSQTGIRDADHGVVARTSKRIYVRRQSAR